MYHLLFSAKILVKIVLNLSFFYLLNACAITDSKEAAMLTNPISLGVCFEDGDTGPGNYFAMSKISQSNLLHHRQSLDLCHKKKTQKHYQLSDEAKVAAVSQIEEVQWSYSPVGWQMHPGYDFSGAFLPYYLIFALWLPSPYLNLGISGKHSKQFLESSESDLTNPTKTTNHFGLTSTLGVSWRYKYTGFGAEWQRQSYLMQEEQSQLSIKDLAHFYVGIFLYR